MQLASALRDHLPDVSIYSGLDDRVSFGPWSATGAEWPLARVLCETPKQVSIAVRIAADHGVPVSVAGGREDVHARNSRSGHLVIDLRGMSGAAYDSLRSVVTTGGGATASMLIDALPRGVVAPTTVNANAGVVGAAAGGGYGLLCGSYGLMCDALVGAEMVLADGDIVTVDEASHPDLLWMLRGGGTGTGIVTRATFATHRYAGVLSGQVMVPLSGAVAALLTAQASLEEHPDALGLLPLIIKSDDGAPVMITSFVWNGSEAEGRAVFTRLAGLPGASSGGAEIVAYRETFDQGDIWPWGQGWASDTRLIARITPEVADALADAAGDMRLPGSILFLHDCHGAATRQPDLSAAFPLRRDHFVSAAVARFSPGDRPAAATQRRWIEGVQRRLTQLAFPGGYVNFLAPEDSVRVAETFGMKAERLTAIKAQHDPHDVFRTPAARLR